MMKKTFFILLFFISSCGYQPIYVNKSSEIYEFKKIFFNGDNYINNKIVNILSIKENNEINDKNILHISSSFSTEEISKNSKGQVEIYKSTINVNLQIKNINNQIIRKYGKINLKDYVSSFIKNGNYENKKFTKVN